MDKITVVFVTKDAIEVKEVEPTLEAYYALLGCDLIDIASRKVGGVYYDIICDDEGLLKDDNHISGINIESGEVMLVGNLIFCHTDDEGSETSLEPDDIPNILSHAYAVSSEAGDDSDACVCVDMDY